MLRKMMIALFACASVAMLAPDAAVARSGFGGGGFHGGGFRGGGMGMGGGFRGGGMGMGGGGFRAAAIGGGGFRPAAIGGGGFRAAALPVGAASAIRGSRFEPGSLCSAATMYATVRVLPVPGPPVITQNLWINAISTARR